MATTKPTLEGSATAHPLWQPGRIPFAPISSGARESRTQSKPSSVEALQALLAFSTLHQQVHRRRAATAGHSIFEPTPSADVEASEQFALDEVLQLVAERAIAVAGADGIGIALAENNEIVLRASAGAIKPGIGARIQRDSPFSGACFRTAHVIRCDDTESDSRVNREACRQLGARSMVAVPLRGRRRVIGVLEAFSAEPFGFNDSDVGSLNLLAELILGALKPEDEDRFAEAALVAEAGLTTLENPADGLSESAQTSSDGEVATAEASIGLPSALLDSADKAEREDKSPNENSLTGEAPSQIKHSDEHHRGMLVLVIMVAVASMLAAGMWWKLTISRQGTSTVQSGQKKAAEPATLPANLPSPITPPGTSQTAQTNSSASQRPATEAAFGGNVAGRAQKLPRITAIRHWSSGDSSTVVLDLEDQVQYEAHQLSGPDRIYFDLHDTSPAPELEGKTVEIGDALLRRVRVAQPVPGLTRVVLETKTNPNYSVSLESNPYRLVVLVRKSGAGSEGRLNLFRGAAAGGAKKTEIIVPPPSQEDLQLRARVQKMRIVVDPGHGGWDLGTVGRHGLLEKDLVLEIAQRLGQLLQSRLGADVILTRNGDNYIPLERRAEVANQSQADLFVSIHANYSDLPSARGVETYYTNSFSALDAKDPDVKYKDTVEPNHSKNASAAGLSPAELHDKIEQSRRLAATVQHLLYETLSVENRGFRDRGVKAASYVVLTETGMPGILAEVSFVSSPADEQRLRSDGYREQIAEALYKAIARYAASSHGVKVASAAK